MGFGMYIEVGSGGRRPKSHAFGLIFLLKFDSSLRRALPALLKDRQIEELRDLGPDEHEEVQQFGLANPLRFILSAELAI
jgi:hypothetical protein